MRQSRAMYDDRLRAASALGDKLDIDRRRTLSSSVNGTAISGQNLNSVAPAAPAGMTAVQFQADASKPANVSAYVDPRPSLTRPLMFMGA